MHLALAPAKINLFLHVTGRRFDGYHSLQSFVFFSDIGDRVSLTSAVENSLRVSGPYGAVLPPLEKNLVGRALLGLKAKIPDLPGFVVHLEKNLPVAAGVGGGSADAAAVIRLVLEATDFRLEERVLQDLLLSLGADVPVCFAARPAMMQGVGDVLQFWPAMPDYGVVLVNPNKTLLTKDVFAKLENFSAPRNFAPPVAEKEWQVLMQQTHNDLMEPARYLCPEISEVLTTIAAQKKCLLARMSGSGATCFGLFPERSVAESAAKQIAVQYPGWWVRAGGVTHGA